MNEIWKQINELDKVYYVSNKGRVKNENNLILKQRCDKYGYKRITFTSSTENKKNKTCFIHRLVAQAFITNTDNYPQVKFKNGNKDDIFVENLEWCRKAVNKNRNCTKKGNPIININTGEQFKNMTMASKKYNVSIGSIYNCCNGKMKTAGGYKWEYL